MAAVIKSPEARQDIDDIVLRIADDSVNAALNWYDQLDLFFKRIANAPGMGTRREFVGKGIRSTPFGQYLVFFRRKNGGLEIVRVIHGARKWQRLLKSVD
jgi:toxin ParE1/3/4